MSRQVVFSKRAELQLAEAFEWWESRSVIQLKKLQRAMYSLIERIAAAPESFPELEDGVREAYQSHFGYSVFFRSTDVEIRIYAVMHYAQDRDDLLGRI